jgi:hypothetical protein
MGGGAHGRRRPYRRCCMRGACPVCLVLRMLQASRAPCAPPQSEHGSSAASPDMAGE